MTISHVYGTYVASRIEGISANVHGLCQALRRAGADVDLQALPVELAGLNRRRTLAIGAWRAGRAAREAAKRPRTELVHVHANLPVTALAARAARIAGGPPVLVQAWNAHAEPGRTPAGIPRKDRLAHRVFNGPEAAALGLRSAPEVVVASQYQSRQLRSLGFKGRVHRVPNGVDTARYRPATAQESEEARTAFGADGDVVLLYYGHASSWKGLSVLVDALPAVLHEHPKASVLLSLTAYGHDGGFLRAALRKRGLEGRVALHGPSDVPRLHAAADLAVLPAPAGVGTACFPNVLLECMSGGVPMVATRVGCVPEVVQDGETGLLARGGDAEELAARLSDLAGDGGMRRRMAAAARRLALQRFDWDVVAHQMLTVYGQLLPDGKVAQRPARTHGPATLPVPETS